MISQKLASRLKIELPSPEQTIQLKGMQISVKRDDSIHPIISGNKWRKIKHYLLDAQKNNTQHIISFGGGFSNHLHALGYCCQQLDIKLTAIVRGDYSQNLSPMLQDLTVWGTDICYVNKITYQQRNSSYLDELKSQSPNAMIIPEGGSSELALQGVREIITELHQDYDYIVAPVASGGTLAGLINAASSIGSTHPPKILGIAVLKGHEYLEELVTQLLPKPSCSNQWKINHDYHFGGYAKSSAELLAFCQWFNLEYQINIEPVYSGKLFFALKELITHNYFPTGSRILALHTGGLQGAR